LTAHQVGGNVTFAELEQTFESCFAVLAAFAIALDVNHAAAGADPDPLTYDLNDGASIANAAALPNRTEA